MKRVIELTDEAIEALDRLLVRLVGAHWKLALASGAGVALLAARTVWYGKAEFAFLVWNLALAWVPVVAAQVVVLRISQHLGGRAIRWLAAGSWLVFFPNAPYLITDLVHWRSRPPVPLWLDGLLLIHFAWLGLMLGFASLRTLQLELSRRKGVFAGWAFAAGALGLASFGIYLGRFHRWNSWDVLVSPLGLGGHIASRVFQPLDHPRAWGFTLLCAAVLLLAYLMVSEIGAVAGGTHLSRRSGRSDRAALDA